MDKVIIVMGGRRNGMTMMAVANAVDAMNFEEGYDNTTGFRQDKDASPRSRRERFWRSKGCSPKWARPQDTKNRGLSRK